MYFLFLFLWFCIKIQIRVFCFPQGRKGKFVKVAYENVHNREEETEEAQGKEKE